MARYVVTGGAGFIGSHIVEHLAGRGDPILVLDDLSTGKRENLAHIRGDIELREVDLAGGDLEKHFEGVDTVFHQAALPSVPLSIRDPLGTHAANVNGTLQLLVACREARVRRVVYASSCALYGDRPELPKREDMPACPVSPYAAQKYLGEVYMTTFWETYGLETVALRYFNVFGPRQDAASPYSGVIARFIPAILRGERPVVYGDGSQSRDFVYVANVVEANLRAAQIEGIGGQVFNVATGRRTTVSETLDHIGKITGRKVVPRYEPARQGDILHSQADATRAEQYLGWRPTVDFVEGLEFTVDWYRRNLRTVAAPDAG